MAVGNFSKSAHVSTTGTGNVTLIPAFGPRTFINISMLSLNNTDTVNGTTVTVKAGSTVLFDGFVVPVFHANPMRFDPPLRIDENTPVVITANAAVTTLHVNATYFTYPESF